MRLNPTLNKFFNNDDFFLNACTFEASLSVAAFLLGWLTTTPPLLLISFSFQAIVIGVLGTLPLILLLLGVNLAQLSSISRIKNTLITTLGTNLEQLALWRLALLASIAGSSEELLFRGVLQPWLEHLVGGTAGFIFSNCLFGLAHAITPLYAFLATLVGMYLSLSMHFFNTTNLLHPIIIHSLYDFLAFLVLIKTYRAK